MGEMMKTISEPRADLKPHAPRIVQITIPGEFIGAVIGTGKGDPRDPKSNWYNYYYY